jgi:hypothetical protein
VNAARGQRRLPGYPPNCPVRGAVRYDRFTSIRDIASTSRLRKLRSFAD